MEGSFAVVHREFDDEARIVITGRDEQGRQLLLRIPASLVEEVPPADNPLDANAIIQSAVDRVLSRYPL